MGGHDQNLWVVGGVDSPRVLGHGNQMGEWVAKGNNGSGTLTFVHFGHDNLDPRDMEGTEIQNLDVGVRVEVDHNGQNLEGTYVVGVEGNPLAFHLVGQRSGQAVRKDVVGMAFPCDAGNLFRL